MRTSVNRLQASQVSADPLVETASAPHAQSAALRRTLSTSVSKSTRGEPLTPALAILALSSSEATNARAFSRLSHSKKRVRLLTLPALRKIWQLRSPFLRRQSKAESNAAFQTVKSATSWW